MSTAKVRVSRHTRTRSFPLYERSWNWDWLWIRLYLIFGFTPSFVGELTRKGAFYNFFYNQKTNRFYTQDRETGALYRVKYTDE